MRPDHLKPAGIPGRAGSPSNGYRPLWGKPPTHPHEARDTPRRRLAHRRCGNRPDASVLHDSALRAPACSIWRSHLPLGTCLSCLTSIATYSVHFWLNFLAGLCKEVSCPDTAGSQSMLNEASSLHLPPSVRCAGGKAQELAGCRSSPRSDCPAGSAAWSKGRLWPNPCPSPASHAPFSPLFRASLRTRSVPCGLQGSWSRSVGDTRPGVRNLLSGLQRP